ncbi:hypothetical protein ATO6_01380 [Oceanicola sp. 22II-s10i]|uniref:hypothetical protein n=1 Tax=Oceanicola sp. 22II-s10i TaxID=1317116 RepID=UPI000B525893|nr:hypothetical protein [Oceanicola sp. 22II-s10i]OWU85611.1 hypothetical protein ATO6_01380 [Oceanicola sp. 22II-s10i]
MTHAAPDILSWRLAEASKAALTRLVGAPLGQRGAVADIRFGTPSSVAYAALDLVSYQPRHGTAATLSTTWHTTGGIDWHEIHAAESDGSQRAADTVTASAPTHAPLHDIEAVHVTFATGDTTDGPRNGETLSIDCALNLVFADGEVLHLTTDFDSIVGAIVVSTGRFDPASLDVEGLTHDVRPLLN